MVARSLDALRPLPNRVLGYVENMSGYACAGCGTVRPLFPEEPDATVLDIPCLGRVPFDPALAQLSDRGLAVTGMDANNEVAAALTRVAAAIEQQLEEAS